MPDLLLDSDVIIEILRGDLVVLEEVTKLRKAGWLVAYTPVAKAEIYHGLKRQEEAAVEHFFASCLCLDLTAEVGEKAGRYLAAYHKSHGMEIAGALVAAAANINRATLFTFNRKHYPMRDVTFHAIHDPS